MSNHRRAWGEPESEGLFGGLGSAFLRDLNRDYRAHGVNAIANSRKNEPRNYFRLLLSLVPKPTRSETDWIGGLSDEDLEMLLRVARQIERLGDEDIELLLKVARAELAKPGQVG